MRIDPTGWAVGFTGCFVDWLITRPWRRIVLGFLPLLAAASVGGLVAWGSRVDRDQLAERYLKLADSEVEGWENQWAPAQSPAAVGQVPEGEVTESEVPESGAPGRGSDAAKPAAAAVPAEIPRFAEVLFRRVQQLHSDNQRSAFFIAMTVAQRGSLQQAMSRLERIAPGDRVGYLPAHAWLADVFTSGPIDVNHLPTIKHHARAALRWERTSSPLLSKISDLFWQTGEPDVAVQAMSLAAQRDAKFNLQLAKLTSLSAKWKLQFEQAVPKAETHFRELVKSNPRDFQARLRLADVLLMKQDHAAAEQLVVDGLKTDDKPELRYALSEIYRLQFVSTSRLTNTSWSGAIELLERAFRVDPSNNKIFDEVAKLARISGSSPSEELEEQLRKLLAEGKATSITHMWLAERYLVGGEMAKAIPHLEQAVKRDPRAARCHNNLAYCLAAVHRDRRDEALTHADQAVALEPTAAEFHDTRGTILMALGRHKDAIAALERAVELSATLPRENAPNPGYHQRLATCYETLGDQAMAQQHAQIAAALTQKGESSAAAEAPANAAPAEAAAPAEVAAPEKAASERP